LCYCCYKPKVFFYCPSLLQISIIFFPNFIVTTCVLAI
jgi:hypothetical protein